MAKKLKADRPPIAGGRWARRVVESETCIICGSLPGLPCLTLKGEIARPHSQRVPASKREDRPLVQRDLFGDGEHK